MAEEKHQQQHEVQLGYPLAPSTNVPRSHEQLESAPTNTYQSQQQLMMKKKNRMKCLAYIALFAVFQTAIILVFVLTIIRVRTPRVRLDDITVTNNGNLRFSARVLIRNRNFGRYNIHSSLATIRSADGSMIGQFVIPDARVRTLSTRRIYVTGDLNSLGSSSNSNSGAGVLSVTVNARLRGEVEFFRVFERRRSADLSCTIMNIDLSNNSVQNFRCQGL
ncbi:hypothetical protein ACJIZ3_001945 [Penstemon smallii]|uniref:Late embryogenesis abundant protein LEA-2 subgroup domain-containing protein n=1 Tax=Penstemon smallii TaxID=265156 RepID=A0ABD3U659_9LAMI